jgi:hypothetical protein
MVLHTGSFARPFLSEASGFLFEQSECRDANHLVVVAVHLLEYIKSLCTWQGRTQEGGAGLQPPLNPPKLKFKK